MRTSGDQSNGVTANNTGTKVNRRTVRSPPEPARWSVCRQRFGFKRQQCAVSTNGDHAYGVYTASGAHLDVSGAEITTSGQNADAVYVSGEGSQLNIDNTTIAAGGGGANGLKADGKSTLTAANTNITVTGSGSVSLRPQTVQNEPDRQPH